MRDKLVYFLNALWVIIYCAIITVAFGLQIFKGETPCPLCYLQRVGMLLVALGALMNLHFGVRIAHYGWILLGALLGGSIALRQIALHACPGSTEFGIPFLGMSLYTWSFLTFIASVLLTAILLLLYRYEQSLKPEKVGSLTQFATLFFLAVAVGNIASSLYDCGIGPCGDV